MLARFRRYLEGGNKTQKSKDDKHKERESTLKKKLKESTFVVSTNLEVPLA
jgi:hypothetical protein